MPADAAQALTVELPEVSSGGLGCALWRTRWVPIICLILSLGAGTWFASHSAPAYTASSRLMFDQISGLTAVRASPVYVQSQADLLTSTSVLNAAGVSLARQHLQTFGDSTDLFGILRQHLQAVPGPGDGTLRVSFTGPNAAESASIVNCVVTEYQHLQSAQTGNGPQAMLVQLNQQKDAAAAELSDSLKQLQAFEADNTNIKFEVGPQLQQQKLSRLNDQLTDAQNTVLTLGARHDSLLAEFGGRISPTTAPTDAVAIKPKSNDDSEVDPAWLQNELSLASANLDVLRSRGLPDNSPSVVDARSAVTRLEKQLADLRQKSGLATLDQLNSDLDVARRREAQLQAAFDSENRAMVLLNEKKTRYARLQAAVARAQSNCDELDAQIKQVALGAVAPVNTHILNEARPESSPVNRKAAAIGLAGGGGLVAGLLLSLGLHLTDQKLRNPSAVRAALRLPVLGLVPDLGETSSLNATGMTAYTDSMSSLAESARTVRSAVFFAGRSMNARTVLVTSAARGEGKTTFASNLAITMAQAGHRTLLLDADYRDSKIPSIFEIVRPTGLSDVLSGKLTLDRAINRTAIERLEVLNGGSIPRSPEELFNSGGFSRLIEQLSQRYQCIVIDSPPVSTHADARILAASADLTLMVVRNGLTRKKAAELALEQLLSVGARVLGAVFNGVRLSKPIRRSRGVLRFVESSEVSAAPSADRNGQSVTTTINLMNSSQKIRMESNKIPEVEILD